jgi:hypothetical protein
MRDRLDIAVIASRLAQARLCSHASSLSALSGAFTRQESG